VSSRQALSRWTWVNLLEGGGSGKVGKGRSIAEICCVVASSPSLSLPDLDEIQACGAC